MQQRLRQAIAQRGVQRLSLVVKAVDLLGELAKAIDRPAAQPVAHRRPQKIEMLVRPKQRVAPGDTRQDHIDAIAKRDLAAVEQQHDRDGRAGLHDPGKTGTDRPPRIGKAVGARAPFDRRQVAVEKPGPPDGIDDIGDIHDGRLLMLGAWAQPARWAARRA